MALPQYIRDRLSLPVFCAPMFSISGPDLVREACKAGFVAALPRRNASDLTQFDEWLRTIRADLTDYSAVHRGAPVGPLAANLNIRAEPADLEADLDVCQRHGVEIVVSVAGNPAELIRRVHGRGLLAYHDVTNLRFAEKAIAAGADGLVCIGAGGGGHSGTISHLALVPRIRAMFDGVIVMAGAIGTGAAVRASEILGADLAYIGTRFIATRESMAADAYKQMLVDHTSADLLYTPQVAGVAANWLIPSIRRNGLDPENLPRPTAKGMAHDHLPPEVKPWKSLWSAGQSVDLIQDCPDFAELARRLRREYVQACELADMASAARAGL